MPHRVLLVLALVAASSGAAPGDDTAARVTRSLQGEWVGTDLEINGKKASDEDAKAFRLSIKSDEINLMTCRGDRCIERKKKYKLDSAKSPMWIDLTTLDGQEKGSTQLSIFSLNKDELRLCTAFSKEAAAERPTEFKTRAGDGMAIIVLHRVTSK
jgi:uncharacterized protein (TIGR03067 family)